MGFVTESIFRRFAPFGLALLITAGSQAASVSSTFNLTNGSLTASSSGYSITGQATMSGVYTGNGAFSSTVSLTGTPTAPNYTITVSGGTLTGIFTFASAALGGTPSPGTLTITGGTGSYAGYTTSTAFSLTETGSFSISGITLNCTGSGTVNTAGGGTTTAPPTIGLVQDAASNTANIAEGSIFSVYGTNLSASSPGLAPVPRVTTFNGSTVTFTPVAGGTGTPVYLVWVGTGQINAILPSSVPVGSYNVTVTNGTVSAAFAAQVVASKPALFTQDGSGTGLAAVQNYISASATYDVNRLTTGTLPGGYTISPAKPGQVLVAWGTGIGPYSAGDNASVSHDFSTTQTIAAIVGGVSIPVGFAGINGYPGEDQINFTLPSNVPTGCAVPLQISVNGVLSAPTSISIAPSAGASACVQTGYTTQQLQSLDQGGSLTSGGFSLSQSAASDPSFGTIETDLIGGAFTQITGFQLASTSAQNYTTTTIGSCQVIRYTTTGDNTVSVGSSKSLDAGTVTVTGPAGSNLTNQKLAEDAGYGYSYTINGFGITGQVSNGTVVAGTYTLTGEGGTAVGPFNAAITLGPPFTLNSALPATVTESAGLPIGWTGGNASDIVQIFGGASTTSGTGASKVTSATSFICTTTAGQKTFTVPASVLILVPTVKGYLDVSSSLTPVPFNATLKADGSSISSAFTSSFITGASAQYQ